MANKYMKCSTSLAIKEMQIKTRMATVKKTTQAGGVPQVVEHLTSKPEALNSNPSTEKKRKQQMLARMQGKRNPHMLLVGM
jgi:hypothetical protein